MTLSSVCALNLKQRADNILLKAHGFSRKPDKNKMAAMAERDNDEEHEREETLLLLLLLRQGRRRVRAANWQEW